ncbi:hypothetical protein GCM10010174_16480 [Kutzneria viridogrisea]|uniref:Mechanosensitive ion channel MscS domain-containing protein n=2 Tax=Kutzneria TaxID=43356 RepID=W5WEY9_9PSEU
MTRPRWSADAKRSLAAGTLACAVVVATEVFGKFNDSAMAWEKVVAIVGVLLFLATSVVAVRSLGNLVVRRTQDRIGVSHAGMVRLAISIVGYLFGAVIALGMLHVGLGQLLVGGALTGVVLGIACQQALGNLFAGLVLLISRPFTIGEAIIVHSGALGGPHEGVVLEMGLVYVVVETDTGLVRLPNSAVLSAGVGPRPVAVEEP